MNRRTTILIAASAVLLIAITATVVGVGRRRPGDLISPRDAYDMIIDRTAVLVDVRDRSSYEELHLAGAILVPLNQVGANAARLAELDRTLIIYCSCPAEETSSAAAIELISRGVEDVLVLRGGVRGWVESDLPVRLGSRR